MEIDFCTTIKNKEEPYFQIKLSDVIITQHSFQASSSADPLPTEEVALGFSKIEWTWNVIDPRTGDGQGKVATKYDPSAGRG
ncbi:MAG: type VI secretion system tube protein Hcp [Pirellulaceae bacterium]|nr:type VI secretion system tube protein Hcp [Pirellulaceae bacterium]